ncbi:MAG: M23 family metallopeptidase [Paraprevotella sp.]|nr:M23 family metallopeptidase [Paraprevotella sp.]
MTILACSLCLALAYSFTELHEDKVSFSRAERRMLHIPTAGLFAGGDYSTVSSADLKRDGWRFPVSAGICFTPEFEHQTTGWYIMSPDEEHEVQAAMEGVVRLVRKTDLGKTVVILHPNGLETVYAHHARTLVKSGDYVEAGQAIAKAGADHGSVYTYFGMMANGIPLDPSVFVNPDVSLKDGVVLFQTDGQGELRASRYAAGQISEREPAFDRVRGIGIVDTDRPFSDLERRHVAVPTPGLFDHSSSFTLDLGREKRLAYPLPGAKVISPYGGKRKNHTGTNLKTRPKDKIRAVFDGVVRFSGKYSAYGNMIVVRHANGLETCYAHNARNLVETDDRVKAGDVIATVGRTGRATTEHCHFEVRVNGVPFNSDYLFDHATETLKNVKLTFKRKDNGSISVKSR